MGDMSVMQNPTTVGGKLSRRNFLRSGAAACAAPAAMASLAASPRAGSDARDTLVLIDLRGGLDGLAACVPTFEAAALAALRPGLAVPTSTSQGAVDLDGSFTLHPSLAPLEPMFRDGELAFVHAIGSADPTRSHFAARRAIDAGAVGAAVQSTTGGWLGRAMRRLPERDLLSPRGVALGAVLPRTLSGGPRVLPIPDPENFTTYGDAATSARRRTALLQMYGGAAPGSAAGPDAGTPRALVGESGVSTVAAFTALDSVDFGRTPASNVHYPQTLLGGRLLDAATMIRAGAATEVIHIDTGDWDDHDDMGPVSGDLAARLDELGRGLAALRVDLGPAIERTTVLVQSEFGRRVDENGSRGTDHGRGGLAFLFGGGVLGGRVVHQWPGLDAASLEGGAMQVTTDLRDLFAEVLTARMGAQNLTGVFPGYVPSPLGLLQ